MTAKKPESRLVWGPVKTVGEELFLFERVEDQSASGRPDLWWCLRDGNSLIGRVELKYGAVRDSTVRVALMKRKSIPRSPIYTGPVPPPPSLGPIPNLLTGLRMDQSLVLGRWASTGRVRCGCLLRLDDPEGPMWLYFVAPRIYPTEPNDDRLIDEMHGVWSPNLEPPSLDRYERWAKVVASPSSLRRVSRVVMGHLTTRALARLLLPDYF